MRLDATNVVKDTASVNRRSATHTWGTSDDGVGIAVSSTSASVCHPPVVCRGVGFKDTCENGTITAMSSTVMEGQR